MTGSPNRLRVLNDRSALAFILDAGAVTRAELGALTGLSKPGVAELLSRLETAGLVEKAEMRPGGPGPAKQTWRVRADVGYAAAVDVTLERVRGRLHALDGAAVAEAEIAWSGADVPGSIGEVVAALLQDAGLEPDALLGAVVGVPGAVDPRTGAVRGAPELPALAGYDVAAALEAELGVGVQVVNDVNLMALAAIADGAAAETRSLAFVWIDEGLGGAIVRDGELVTGFTGGAGEVDLLPVAMPEGASMRLADALSPAALADLAAGAGLPTAEAALDADSPVAAEVARRIAAGLAAIVAVLDPELVLLGGRYGAPAADRLADAIRSALAELLETDPAALPSVRPYPVGPDAALTGAGRIALAEARRTAFATGSLPASADPLRSSS
ncbi:MAG TPA: ROK family transcriptional regulator [Amnibacterium sp.]|jgi:predicted NBD/HSP70 family sugar kinase|uniref:ROK family transcriptional regulator n=1 Tax=Amnibacterium sp. TaxID=1872496 RepID=UPI002F952DFE